MDGSKKSKNKEELDKEVDENRAGVDAGKSKSLKAETDGGGGEGER